MSARLDAYLDVERNMLALDDVDDPMADALRDALDTIWYALTDEERTILNRREIAPGPVYAVRVAVDDSLFVEIPALGPPNAQPNAPIDEWTALEKQMRETDD